MGHVERRGIALFEVLVALAILGVAGSGVVAVVIETAGAVHRARASDEDTRQASAFLDKVALWQREDLDRHLGQHRQGPWALQVQRTSASIYEVSLSDSSGNRTLLGTALYRRAPAADSELLRAHR
jgi:type II secretory pathway pseudopilin PulG